MLERKIQSLIEEAQKQGFIETPHNKTPQDLVDKAGKEKLAYLQSEGFPYRNAAMGAGMYATTGLVGGAVLGRLAGIGTSLYNGDDPTTYYGAGLGLGALAGTALGAGHGYFSTLNKSKHIRDLAKNRT